MPAVFVPWLGHHKQHSRVMGGYIHHFSTVVAKYLRLGLYKEKKAYLVHSLENRKTEIGIGIYLALVKV